MLLLPVFTASISWETEDRPIRAFDAVPVLRAPTLVAFPEIFDVDLPPLLESRVAAIADCFSRFCFSSSPIAWSLVQEPPLARLMVSSSSLWVREVTITFAPSSWQISAIALPIPRPPPVTRILFPFRSCAESAEEQDMTSKHKSRKYDFANDFIAIWSIGKANDVCQ